MSKDSCEAAESTSGATLRMARAELIRLATVPSSENSLGHHIDAAASFAASCAIFSSILRLTSAAMSVVFISLYSS